MHMLFDVDGFTMLIGLYRPVYNAFWVRDLVIVVFTPPTRPSGPNYPMLDVIFSSHHTSTHTLPAACLRIGHCMGREVTLASD